MTMNIYTPRPLIDVLYRAGIERQGLNNPCVCTKIPYKGFEVSIRMESSCGPDDLDRSDIRIFEEPGSMFGRDVTYKFFPKEIKKQGMLNGDGNTLKAVFRRIDNYVRRTK